ncbi:DUF3761 domain-containing protein [Streptomyces sp. NPDC013172]
MTQPVTRNCSRPYETAKCKDASLSYSRHSQGTCSRHHGVRYWFK